jgi:hypothetical protein
VVRRAVSGLRHRFVQGHRRRALWSGTVIDGRTGSVLRYCVPDGAEARILKDGDLFIARLRSEGAGSVVGRGGAARDALFSSLSSCSPPVRAASQAFRSAPPGRRMMPFQRPSRSSSRIRQGVFRSRPIISWRRRCEARRTTSGCCEQSKNAFQPSALRRPRVPPEERSVNRVIEEIEGVRIDIPH